LPRALDLLDRHASLMGRQGNHRALWQELADILHPDRGNFVTPLIPGQETASVIYDGTPMQARRGLATAIDGLLKPQTSQWFWMRAGEDEDDDTEEEKGWFEAVADRMRKAIYSSSAGFIPQSGAVDNDLATFGIGYLWVAENKARNGLAFRSIPIGDAAIDEDADGRIDTFSVERRLTARQARQKWGEDLGPKVMEALRATDPKARDKVFTFVQQIYPRADRDTRKRDSGNLPFASCTVCKEDEHIVEETGFHEFPVMAPRWEVVPGHVYPRSPGMMALPDARTLQAMGHTLLVGGQRAVDPPVWAVDDGVLSAVRSFPGGLTIVDAETVRQTNGRPMGTLDMGANIPVGREMQDDYRRQVEAAFFRNVFNLPVDGRQMTATEILERKEEFLRTIGPTLGQLEHDYIGAMVTRVFGIMLRAGQFPEPPESLQGRDVRFEFMSPVQQAKRQIEAAGLARGFEFMAPIIELDPTVADNFDGDAVARDMPDAFGWRQKWLRPIAERDALRESRQQAQAGAGALAEGGAAAGIVKQLADAGAAGARAMPAEAA
jgi:hypothetical protein